MWPELRRNQKLLSFNLFTVLTIIRQISLYILQFQEEMGISLYFFHETQYLMKTKFLSHKHRENYQIY